jgi:hypothetical protein
LTIGWTIALMLIAASLAQGGAFGVAKEVAERIAGARRREAWLRECLAAAFEAVDRGDGRRAIEECVNVVAHSRDAKMRREAVRVLAYAYATTGAWDQLHCLLGEGGAAMIGREELARYVRAARELGREDDACGIAELAGARVVRARAPHGPSGADDRTR